MIESQKDVETILSALGDQLESLLDKPVELLVCGGSALNVLGLVRRATKDVDILAYIERPMISICQMIGLIQGLLQRLI
jgi:predicted nucleotidyltransferase